MTARVYRLSFIDTNGVPYAVRHEAEDLDMAVACAQLEWPPVKDYELVGASVTDDGVKFESVI